MKIKVWDAPQRVLHWLLAASFAGAWMTSEGEAWRLVHVTLGYTVAALVGLRIAWGFAGARHARFANFVRAPSAALAYLRGVLAGRPEHHAGHNPAGGLAILALLGAGLAASLTGWFAYQDIGGEPMTHAHEALANAMLAVVLLHLAGVLTGSLVHRENLALAMLTGRKRGERSQAIARTRPWLAAILVCAVLGFWWQQLHVAPSPATLVQYAHTSR
jgi:cytochrome b